MRLDASAKLALRLATAGSFVGSFVAGLAPVAAQDAGVLYRETFDVPPSISDGKAIAAEQGWLGFRNGGSFNNPCADAEPGETCLQAFGPGCSAATPVNSDPVPGFTEEGNAFWSPTVIGVTIYSEEYPIDAATILQSTISFDMRHSQTGTNNRLALRIGDTWYMSEESVSYTATGECQKAIFMDLEDAIFGATPEVTSCTTPPCGPFKPESFDTLLPDTGTVDAFGIFIDGTGANHRFDNYTIALNPSSFRNLGQCISTFIEVSCSGLTGRQRATCVQVQQEACRAAF